ncbi:hypothetical protein [Granulicella sibirica]|uniref:Serine phosphatase RsbU, regulator of sigma subunit n=1 Tax=Granulicella sibirica TaxID=2479048 RepID=A0A4Q0SYF9_9BACT|nr:hypothetical protein [Granulicella sibirica]RXH54539.1 Serine phosphatase RsbU, regulator of sigma subunit [Granulicella sibirica]
MYDFENFGLAEMVQSGKFLRELGQDSACMEDAACEVVDFLYEAFRVRGSGESACALVRCFKTHTFGELPPDLREAATHAMHGGVPSEAMPCLTLLATRGLRPEWNSRHASNGHKAIPLATAEMVNQAPMIARLVQQMGLEPGHLIGAASGELEELERRTLDVFHVERARDSAFVPSQNEFVKPYGVCSVLGFGGLLPTGELFFVVLFSIVPIRQETASLFRTLALGVKLVLLRHLAHPVFSIA